MTQPLSSWSAQVWQNQLKQYPASSLEQAWREQQLQEFLKRGFPQRREEAWRYTSLAALLQQSFNFTSPLLEESTLDLNSYSIPNTHRLVLINGIFSSIHSTGNNMLDGVSITHQDHDQTGRELNTTAHLSVFHYLNNALMRESLSILVNAGVQASKPLHILCVNSGYADQGIIQHPHHRVTLQENSRLTLIEEFIDLDGQPHFNNGFTKMTLAANSQLNYYKFQRQNKHSFHIANTLVVQERDSEFKSYHFAQGGKLNREDVHIALQESGAACDLAGFYHPYAGQLIDFHTRIDHYQPYTHSCQYYKGMVEALGCGVFNGKIIVHPQAQKISAYQQNHNLLLADSSEVNTKPELEVYADNVKCSHGATVGRIDPNALFYLRSRGLTESAAQQMLKLGFFREIFERFPDKNIADYMQSEQGAVLDV